MPQIVRTGGCLPLFGAEIPGLQSLIFLILLTESLWPAYCMTYLTPRLEI